MALVMRGLAATCVLLAAARISGAFASYEFSPPEKNIVGARTASGAIIATSSPTDKEIEGDAILRDTQMDADISAHCAAHAPKSLKMNASNAIDSRRKSI